MGNQEIPHRQTVKEKESAQVEEMRIDFIPRMKSIKDYGEVHLCMTNDYLKLINSATCPEEKAEYVGRLVQLNFILHDVAMATDIY